MDWLRSNRSQGVLKLGNGSRVNRRRHRQVVLRLKLRVCGPRLCACYPVDWPGMETQIDQVKLRGAGQEVRERTH
jgi:hypothetical protein